MARDQGRGGQVRLGRCRRVLVAGAVVAVVSMPGVAGAGRARPDQEGVKLQAVAGYGGWIAEGRTYPVVVKVTSDRLLQATLQFELVGMGGTTVVERDIELAGGNSATYRLLAPEIPVERGMGGLQVDTIAVQLVVDGEAVAANRAEVEVDPANELVGVFPEALAALGTGADLPGSLPLRVDVGQARPVEVDTALLELGPGALEPLDQVVVTPGELAELPEEQRAAVVSWVEAGGQLLVSGDPAGLPDSVLPAGWLPPAGGGVRAGLGRVRAVSATWQDEILPSPTRSASEEEIIADSVISASDTVGGRLSHDAGVRLPPGGRLGVLLGLYVLIVGPVAYLVLRRLGRRRSGADPPEDGTPLQNVRRPLAAWAAIPAVALVSTGAVVGAGGSLRRHAASAHVTVYEVGPGSADATTWSLLSNPGRRGEVGIDLPAGWSATEGSTPWEGQGATVRVAATDDGEEATTRPPAGGFGMIRSSGPAADMVGALEVTAQSPEDDVITGTVRNRLDVPLEDVVVFVGRAALAEVGDLQPGEQKDFTVARASQFAFQADPERRVWPDAFGGEDMGRGVVVLERAQAAAEVDAEMQAEIVAKSEAIKREAELTAGAQPPPPVTVPPPDPAKGEVIIAPGQPVPLPEPVPGPAPDEPPVFLPPGKPVFPDGPGGLDGEADEDPTMLAAWAQIMQEHGWNYRPTGQVVAVGWTDELDPPVSPSGSGKVSRSRSAVVARATAAPAGDRLSDAASVRSLVRGPGTNGNLNGDIPAVVAFDLPASVGDRPVDPSRLMFNLLGPYTSTEVWTPAGWVPLPDVPDAESAQVPVPAGAVVGGQVFVRWTHPMVVPPPGREFVLYEKET